MAIFHFKVQLIKRGEGRSVVAAAAYRSGMRLFDERLQRYWNYHTRQKDIPFSEIMAPADLGDWVQDRAKLWNRVEAKERQWNAQLAREVVVALPIELSQAEQISLLKQYCQKAFVEKGMIADINLHNHQAHNPHAHILLTMREVTPEGFGNKARDWNHKALLREHRKGWELVLNESLARGGIDKQVDSRSLKDRGLDLIPNLHLGPSAHHAQKQGRSEAMRRCEDALSIMRENGQRLLKNPGIILEQLMQGQSVFTDEDLFRYLNRNTADLEQFQAAYRAVQASKELICLDERAYGNRVYTTRQMVTLEAALLQKARCLEETVKHRVRLSPKFKAPDGKTLTKDQHHALKYLLDGPDIRLMLGYAGTGKSFLMKCARLSWERAGYRVTGMALSGIAAQNLGQDSGIPCRTIDSYLWRWNKGFDLPGKKDIVVLDEAGMVDTAKLERIIKEVQLRRAKLVLLGDPAQLQAIEAGAPFRLLAQTLGYTELSEIMRQRSNPEMQRASLYLARQAPAKAIEIYEKLKSLHYSPNVERAIQAMVDRWEAYRKTHPEKTQLMLAYQREHVAALNEAARARRLERGELMYPATYRVKAHPEAPPIEKSFCVQDQIYFLKNDAELGVKNGHLGTILGTSGRKLLVLVQDTQERIYFNVKDYPYFDYGYATTIHKSQGITVDRVQIMLTQRFDRHLAYVGMTRHRESLDIHIPRDELSNREALMLALNREREKEMVFDFGEMRGLNTIQRKPDTINNISQRSIKERQIERSLLEQRQQTYAFLQPGERVKGPVIELLDIQQFHPRGVVLTEKGEYKILPRLHHIEALKGKEIELTLDKLGKTRSLEALQRDERGRLQRQDLSREHLGRAERERSFSLADLFPWGR